MALPASFMLHVTWKISRRSPSWPSRLLQETSLRVRDRNTHVSPRPSLPVVATSLSPQGFVPDTGKSREPVRQGHGDAVRPHLVQSTVPGAPCYVT